MNIFKIIQLLFIGFLLQLPTWLHGQSTCVGDTLRPVCIAPPDMTLKCDSLNNIFDIFDTFQEERIDSLLIIELFGAAESVDNCNSSIIEYPTIFKQEYCGDGEIIRRFLAIDENGNESQDTSRQVISSDKNTEFFIQFPDLNMPYQRTIRDMEYTPIGCHIYIQGGTTTYIENERGDTVDLYTDFLAVNWCLTNGTFNNIPPLDINNDGIKGDAFTLRGIGDSVYIPRPNLPDLVLPFFVLKYSFNQEYLFKGNVFGDLIDNCQKDATENGLQGFLISIRSLPSGRETAVETDEKGDYNHPFEVYYRDTMLEISIDSKLNIGQACGNTYLIPIPSDATTIEQDFPVKLNSDCPVLSVDIGAARLRRCFANTYYVNYCNYSSVPVKDARIDIQLDPFLEYKGSTNSSIPAGDNTFYFPISEIAAGECGQFLVNFLLSCEAELGQTHCVEARISPNELCTPISDNWSGASIEVTGECEGDSVQLKIENIGDGAMIQENNFVVTEDVLMLRQGTFQLDPQESLALSFAANGATYRLAAEQELDHPGKSAPSISLEGCAGINTSGLVNAFPQDDGNLFESIDCQENRGSYDPNDKSAVPSGWGAAHYLAKNTDLDYLIRFQNTGTDTAFKVVITDTLSTFLDAATIIPGAASHTYTYHQFLDSTSNLTVIRFTFNDILLPDSTTNQVGSNGFVKFKIAQQLDLPNDTRLENKAAIFFDFNEPIITNTVFHTIGQPFRRIGTATNDFTLSARFIQFQPNPFSEKTTLKIGGAVIKKGNLVLYDVMGKTIYRQSFTGNSVDIYRNNLQDGFYFYKISSEEQLIGSGKLLLNGF